MTGRRDEARLLPCPFCGDPMTWIEAAAVFSHSPAASEVAPENARCFMRLAYFHPEQVAAWNTRALSTPPATDVDVKLVERLLRTEFVNLMRGEGYDRPINPEGPAAAARISQIPTLIEEERAAEREAAVAWLERQVTNHRARNDLEHGENIAYQQAADAIESGAHRALVSRSEPR